MMYFATTYKWKWGLQEIFFFMRCCYEVTGFKCCGEICCTVKKLYKICFEVIKQVMAKNVVWRKQKKIVMKNCSTVESIGYYCPLTWNFSSCSFFFSVSFTASRNLLQYTQGETGYSESPGDSVFQLLCPPWETNETDYMEQGRQWKETSGAFHFTIRISTRALVERANKQYQCKGLWEI